MELVYETQEQKYYAKILKCHLEVSKGNEDMEAVEALFADDAFIEILYRTRMDLCLREEKKKPKYNKKVLEYCMGALALRIQEQYEEENIEFLYFYLKECKVKNEIHTLLMISVSLFAAFIIGYMALNWYIVDAWLIFAAPSKEDITKQVHEKYGIELATEDIQAECEINNDYRTNTKYIKKVTYIISKEDEIVTGTYIPGQEVVYDIEMLLVKEKMEKYFENVSGCEYDEHYFYCVVSEDIIDQNDKTEFLQRLKSALTESWENDFIRERFINIEMNIYMEENNYFDGIHVFFGKSDLTEKLEKVSSEMDMVLEGISDEEEVLDMKEFLENME